MIERACIIGVGHIGGSLARDLRRLGLCREVVGYSRRRAHLERAVALGVIDAYHADVKSAVDGADLVVVAVPLGVVPDMMRAVAPALRRDAILTDVGSAKLSVVRAVEAAFGRIPANFVPGHPIAGTESSGVEASVEGLFRDHRVILTPVPETGPAALGTVRALWEAVGAEVLEMDPDHHDEVLAATSHLPHMLAYTLMDVLGRMAERVEIFRYSAGGLRDFTRIASSDPKMWHDICMANPTKIVESLERFSVELSEATEAIRRGDGPRLMELFTRAKSLRDRHVGEARVRPSPHPRDRDS